MWERITTSGVKNTLKSPVSSPPLEAGTSKCVQLTPVTGGLSWAVMSFFSFLSFFLWSYKIHHIPDGPPQSSPADWDMSGLLEGHTRLHTHNRSCTLTLQTDMRATQQQLCISAGRDYREGSVLGSRPDWRSPPFLTPNLIQGYAGARGSQRGGCHRIPLFNNNLQNCHTHCRTCGWPSTTVFAELQFVCLRGRAPSFSGRAGGEEIPLLFPRKPIGCVRLIKETQKRFEAEGWI